MFYILGIVSTYIVNKLYNILSLDILSYAVQRYYTIHRDILALIITISFQ